MQLSRQTTATNCSLMYIKENQNKIQLYSRNLIKNIKLWKIKTVMLKILILYIQNKLNK